MSKKKTKVVVRRGSQDQARRLTEEITGKRPDKLRDFAEPTVEPKKRLIPFDIQHAVRMVRRVNIKEYDIAKHFGIHRGQLRRELAKFGYENYTDFKEYHHGNRRKAKDRLDENDNIPGAIMFFDIDKAIELVSYQIPATGIAQHFGMATCTLNEHLRRHGYKNFTDFKQHHNMRAINDVRANLFKKANNEGYFPALKLLASSYTEINENRKSGDGTNSKVMPKIYYLDSEMNEDFIKLDLDEDSRAIVLKKTHFLKHQWEFIKDFKTKFLCLLAGLGGGKTHIFLRKCLVAHINEVCTNGDNIGKSDGLVIYPTLKMGKALFWQNFLNLLDQVGIAYVKNVSDYTVTTQFGIVRLLSGEDPDRIVGYNCSWIGIDEIDTIRKSKEVWDNANARLRGKEDAQMFTVSTPEGYGLLYNKFVKEPQSKLERGEEVLTRIIRAKTIDNPFLPDDFIDALRNQYTDKQLEAYLNGEFVNFKGSSAYAFQRDVNVGTVNYNKEERIYVGMDFNVNPMSFILFHTSIVYDDKGNPTMEYLHVFNSVSLPNSNTRKACEWIKTNYPDKDITFIVDRSGDARKTSADKTDVQIIREYGFKCNFLNNLSERDKLNIVNNELEKGRILIDERNGSFLIDDLEAVILNDYGKICKKNLLITHQSDALAYSTAWLLRKRKRIDSYAGYGGLM